MQRNRAALVGLICLLTGSLLAARVQGHVGDRPSVHDTVAAVITRLGETLSTEQMQALATQGDRVLAALTPKERQVLGHGLIRFRVNVPVTVYIAAAGAAPFWLKDQGYEATPWTLANSDGEFVVYRKGYGAGWVGLGVNAIDRTVSSQYAVLVQPARQGAKLKIDPLHPGRHRVVPASGSTSPYADEEKPFRELPDALAGSFFVQTLYDERHAALLVRDRVWRTRYPASTTPDHVVVSFGADPRRSLTWTWRTSTKVTQTALRLAPAAPDRVAPADAQAIRTLRGTSQSVYSQGLVNDPVIRRHRVVATGLEPDTTYVYALGNGSDWTPWRAVKTAPAEARDFGFIYLGDAQNGLDTWGKLIRGAHRRRPDAAFILMAGDLVDRGNERSDWDLFFQNAAGVFDTVPMMPCAGNHEYQGGKPRMYRAFFALPNNGPDGIDSNLVYSFEYSDAFFAILDSNLGNASAQLAQRQASWLDAALEKTKATWKFVMFHHPIYSSAPKRDNPLLRQHWVPVFDKHRVDMVLQGHDHAYLRTYPMRANRRVEGNEPGTVYVVSVSGTKYYEQVEHDYTERGFTNISTYQTLDFQIRDGRLLYRALDINGKEVDQLVIEKPTRQG